MTDEEFVRANWDDARLSQLRWGGRSWYSLAEFTRDWLEQIRQLERQIALIRSRVWDADQWKRGLSRIGSENIVDAVREEYEYRRILSRLESPLAGLKRGMKPTP